MAHDLSVQMRLGLAVAGITLDEPKRDLVRPPAPPAAPLDRDAVRAELERRGATAEQLRWLVPSCPSMSAARSFTPIRKL